jgi:hypothetical protein
MYAENQTDLLMLINSILLADELSNESGNRLKGSAPAERMSPTEYRRVQAGIIADHLEDNFRQHPEVEVYVKRLRSKEPLRMRTLLDIGCKFGNRRCRKVAAKIGRLVLRHRQRWNSRGATLAWMKKRFSLQSSWPMKDNLRTLLKIVTDNPALKLKSRVLEGIDHNNT